MIDLSPMFPEYHRAEAEIDGDDVNVKLFMGNTSTYSTIKLSLSKIFDCLERLRKVH